MNEYQNILNIPKFSGLPILKPVSSGFYEIVVLPYDYPYISGIMQHQSGSPIIKVENNDNKD